MGSSAFVFFAIVVIFIASQLFWFRRIREWGTRLIPNPRLREWLGGLGVILFLFLFAYNFAWGERSQESTHLTLRAALLEAPFLWWMLASLLGFLFILPFGLADRLAAWARWFYARLFLPSNPGPRELISPGRRRFLEQTVYAAGAAPFVAGAYGLLYGRLNLETTRQTIRLRRLPKAFDGFRIAQLSDIHIGPFMAATDVRKYVAITNELKPDLVALTGDFITWDPTTQEAVVRELARLKAPFGIFGCLGNHELWSHTQASITRMFAAHGIKMLRQERAPVRLDGEALNLIGVDFQTRRRMGPPGAGVVGQYLEGVEQLVMPNTTNILFTHNPNAFDRAAELGIDLSLAGHTHGGQITLEFISPALSPSRLITPYGRGLFHKGDAQLYVNRGIGTIFVPVRFGAPPEITLYELRQA